MEVALVKRVNNRFNVHPTGMLVREPNWVVQDSLAQKELCVLRVHIAFCFVQDAFEVVHSDLSWVVGKAARRLSCRRRHGSK